MAANFYNQRDCCFDACNSFDLHCGKESNQTIAELKN
jgi:hypothetical protein